MKPKKQGDLSGSASDLFSGGDRFESLPKHQQNK
jgi:hypothetical protein